MTSESALRSPLGVRGSASRSPRSSRWRSSSASDRAGARAESDPALRWYTIETPHFRVTYHSGLEQVAQHVANVAESIYGDDERRARLDARRADRDRAHRRRPRAPTARPARCRTTRSVCSSPRPRTCRRSATSTTGTSSSSRTSTRTSSTPTTSAACPRSSTPCSARRSRRTRCSRAGSSKASASTRRARARAPAASATRSGTCSCAPTCSGTTSRRIDQLSNVVRRWPQGNLCYLYGSYFTEWIAQTYGEEALRKMSRRLRQADHPVGLQSIDPSRHRQHVRRDVSALDRQHEAALRRAGRARCARRASARARASPTTVRSPATRAGSRRTRGRSTRAASSTTATTSTSGPGSGRSP